MNQRDAMKALLDGKRIRQDHHNNDVYFELDERGELRNHRGDHISLLGGLVMNGVWRLYEEPNPHKPGTFNWAREEARRGRHVRRAAMSAIKFTEYAFKPNMPWALENIDATDWEHA